MSEERAGPVESIATEETLSAREKGLESRLNQVATTLVGATAGVSALFALLGANSERVWTLLDDTNNKKLLAATTACALLAITLGLRALLEDSPARAGWLLLSGAAAFVMSLALTVWTAAAAANIYARPAFTEVSVVRTPPEAVVLRFTVRAASLDRSQRIAVRVVEQETGRLMYDATLPPDEKAIAEQKLELPMTGVRGPLLLAAWHRDRSKHNSAEPQCEQQDLQAGRASNPSSGASDLRDGTACLTLLP